MTMFTPDAKPEFCFITPTAYLDAYATRSNAHLVLAHIVDNNPTYAAFYQRMAARGDRIIMDNGAFELGQSYEPSKLVELGKKCGAHAIVLPDYPGKPSNITIEAAIKWTPVIRDAGFATMFVPQSEIDEVDDWIDCYMWAADNPNIDIIGMSILGIPNALPHIPAAYARVVMTEILLDRGVFNPMKYHHYLGLNAGPALEVPPLLEVGALNSIDSSNPVWAGINGVRYNISTDSYLPIKKSYLREVDFDTPMTKREAILEAIGYNLTLTLDLFTDK